MAKITCFGVLYVVMILLSACSIIATDTDEYGILSFSKVTPTSGSWINAASNTSVTALVIGNQSNYNLTLYMDGVENSSISCKNDTYCSIIAFDGIDDGTYSWDLRINATETGVSLFAYEGYNFTAYVDKTNPSVGLYTPVTATNISSRTHAFVVQANDSNEAYCYLHINGFENESSVYTSTYNVTFSSFDLADGDYLWDVQCEDLAGNKAFSGTNNTLTVDTTAPVLVLETENGTWFKDTYVILNLTVTELNGEYCDLSINDTANYTVYEINSSQSLAGLRDTSIYEVLFNNSYAEGYFNFNMTCNDTAGNIGVLGTSDFILNVDNTTPSDITCGLPTNGTISTDYSPYFNWTETTDVNFAFYRLMVDNDSDMLTPLVNITVDNMSTAYYTILLDMLGDTQYYWAVNISDMTGREIEGGCNVSESKQKWYKPYSVCHNLTVGWNLCGIAREVIDADTLQSETGATYISKLNSSHDFQTYVYGSATNQYMQFNRYDTVFIYVASNTTWEGYYPANSTYIGDSGYSYGNEWTNDTPDYFNVTLHNTTTGWNVMVMQNTSGMTFQDVWTIHAASTACAGNITSIVYVKNTAASNANDRSVATRYNVTYNNGTTLSYLESFWVYDLNRTGNEGEPIELLNWEAY